ncbi:efflux RND transporter permease subunit [Nannocystis pusilla]|uniref:Efflux RND transporter permease subunit n=1 Tax=Nannocystis pusilla TaxID=889268 RepID=A0A9X3F7G2_9BACT|nr:efflux RND transporter permease subunit [Nannocystis pusilla]
MSGSSVPGPDLRDNGMVRLSLVRPVTMMMALLSAVVIGVVAFFGIPLELIPSGFSPPFLMIEVPYPNATAQDIEDRITRPLEQSLATTPGLEEISATSRADRASVTLVFEGETDMDVAYREVRDRVARAAELPSDVQRVRINKQSGAGIPVAFYSVTWDESIDLPRDRVQKHLVRAIERIDGVALVNLWGKEDREIRIELNRPLAEAAGVNIFTLAQKLSQANFNLASGEIRDPDGRFVVRSLATYQTVQQLEDTIVGQKNLRLKDIADVVYDYPESDRIDRFNGRPSMVLFVLKESQANTVEVCDKIREAVEAAVREPGLSGFDVKAFFMQGDAIRYSLNQVTSSGLQGGVLAIVVLLFFLRRVRLTLLIAASIPLSIFLSLPVMYFLDQSINIISLLGLMICVGLVVDNSVVVAENIDRYRERGMGPYAAALHGASEVALPITLATLTTMIVFAPAALLSSGPTQFFMIRMVTPVCVSLLASLFVALVLVPMTSAMALGTPDPLRRRDRRWRAVLAVDAWWKQWMGRLYTATLGRVNAWYGALLRGSLRRRIDVVIPSLLMLAATCAIPMQHVKFSSGENMGTRNFWAYYSMPSDITKAEAEKFFGEVERSIAEVKDQYRISGQYIGFDGSFAQVQVFFEPQEPGERPFNEVRQEVYDKMPSRPGWVKEARFGGADGGQDNTFMVTLYGDDHRSVQEARETLQTALLQQPGVLGVSNRGSDAVRRDELALAVDRTMTERFGIPAGNIASSIAYAIRGQVLPRFQSATEDREIEVRIRYRKEDREQLGELLEFKVPSEKKPGTVVPVRVLTEMTVQKGEQALIRNDKRVAALIRLELAEDDRLAVMDKLRKFIETYRLPAGISFDADRDTRETDTLRNDMVGAMILSTAFIFLVMGFLFESFILPMSVLPSIPLSFIGVWWFLMLTGSPIDALAVIGILLLLGVVVNNGIVLVDFINSARASGLSREEAIVQAGMQRFRPILMTALTTVGGMIPLAFTTPNGEGLDYGPFGKTLVGGMTTATVLTLVVVPVAYTYFDDLRIAAGEWARRVLWRRR